MSPPETGPARNWRKEVLQLADLLVGHNLLVADAILDEVRRIAWLIRFGGIAKERAVETLKSPPLAITIHAPVAELSLDDLAVVLMELRLFVWMGNFARVPGSAFGQQLAMHAEYQDLMHAATKLN